MQEQNPISSEERLALWSILAVLVAGWWGVIAALFHLKINGPLVCFGTLNVVLTLGWFAARMEKRSPDFRYTFALVTRITAAWLPTALAALASLIFLSGPVSVTAASTHMRHPSGYSANTVWTTHALVVSGGVAAAALLTLFLKRRKLLTVPQTF